MALFKPRCQPSQCGYDCLAHPFVSIVCRVQPVIVPRKIILLRAVEREYSRNGVEVYHWYRPDISRLLNRIDVRVNIFPASVGVVLVRLDVGLAEFGIPPVKRCW